MTKHILRELQLVATVDAPTFKKHHVQHVQETGTAVDLMSHLGLRRPPSLQPVWISGIWRQRRSFLWTTQSIELSLLENNTVFQPAKQNTVGHQKSLDITEIFGYCLQISPRLINRRTVNCHQQSQPKKFMIHEMKLTGRIKMVRDQP